MPNNPRTKPDASYVNGFAPSSDDWRDLDRKAFESVNGDKGGAYALTGNLTIAGGVPMQVNGPTRLTGGGSIRAQGSRFVLPDGTWPKLGKGHPGRSRRIVQALYAPMGPTRWMFARHPTLGGIASIALAVRDLIGSTIFVPELHIPLRVVDGAVLSKVEFSFRVLTPRDAPPIATPKFRVVRVPKDSYANPSQPLLSTADGTGFASPPIPPSGAAWYAEGGPQTFTYVPDQHETIDIANFHYVAQIVEEQGAKGPADAFDGYRFVGRAAPVMFRSTNDVQDCVDLDTVAAPMPGGADVIDSYKGGFRMLVNDTNEQIDTGATDAANGHLNGIWLQRQGPWVRAPDLANPSDFTPGLLVPVALGVSDGGTLWQLQSPWAPASFTLDKPRTSARPQFTPPVARGNLYTAITPTFAIEDLRFQ